MFEARIAREPFPDLQAAGDRAFAVLEPSPTDYPRLRASNRARPR